MNINDDIIEGARDSGVREQYDVQVAHKLPAILYAFFVCRRSLYACCCAAVVARGGVRAGSPSPPLPWLVWMHDYLLVNIIASMWHVQCERNKICCFVQIICISNLFSRLFNFTFAVRRLRSRRVGCKCETNFKEPVETEDFCPELLGTMAKWTHSVECARHFPLATNDKKNPSVTRIDRLCTRLMRCSVRCATKSTPGLRGSSTAVELLETSRLKFESNYNTFKLVLFSWLRFTRLSNHAKHP